jgi:rhamnose transport system ATP-binding protein
LIVSEASGPPAGVTPLLEARSISKSFSGVHALREVSFDVRAGEVHALVGENGAGKSTLIKILTGAEVPDTGSLTIGGHAVDHLDPDAAHRQRVAAIYQHPSLFPHLTVTENVALALERRGMWRRVDWEARRSQAARLLDEVGAAIDPDRLAGTLSMPEQQIVEIAKAVGADARVMVMDEPTASLASHEVERLFRIIGKLRSQGAGVVYVSHRLPEVFAVADRITVLRDGQLVTTRGAADLTPDEIVRLMVGRELNAIFPSRTAAIGDVVLDIRRLSNAALGLREVSFQVRAGEILGLAGLIGSGRTELAETLFGIAPATGGEVTLRGERVHISTPLDALRLGVAYLPEDRLRHGVVAEMAVDANVTLASLRAYSDWGLIDRPAERASSARHVDRLRIKVPSASAPVAALSGGNQQKVALARWLETNPAVLILDEPTQGVDVGAKSEIHAIVQELAARGLACILISSELPEILGMCDRIAVMRGGTIVSVIPRREATQESILEQALGHAPAAPLAG